MNEWQKEFEQEELERLEKERALNLSNKLRKDKRKISYCKQKKRLQLHNKNKKLKNSLIEDKIGYFKKEKTLKNKSHYKRWNSIKDWKDYNDKTLPYRDRKKIS